MTVFINNDKMKLYIIYKTKIIFYDLLSRTMSPSAINLEFKNVKFLKVNQTEQYFLWQDESEFKVAKLDFI